MCTHTHTCLCVCTHTHTCACVCVCCVSVHTIHLSYPLLCIHPRTPAHASSHTSVHTCARIGGAAAHNGQRRIEPRPSASAAVARRGPKAAHTPCNTLTDAVFHALMFVLNADAWASTCEPNRGRRRRKVFARFGANACAPKRTRASARKDAHVGACVGQARIARSVHPCS